MPDQPTLTFIKDENGDARLVTTETKESSTLLTSVELMRQINEHTDIIHDLQLTLQAVVAFETGETDQSTVAAPTVVDTPIVNTDALQTVAATVVVPPAPEAAPAPSEEAPAEPTPPTDVPVEAAPEAVVQPQPVETPEVAQPEQSQSTV